MRPGHVCPGKPPSTSESMKAALSFNEAGACLPRKFPVPQPDDEAARASMRPGHVCPGNRARHVADRRQRPLQ